MKNLKYPLIIKWSITNKCNLRCKHCYMQSYENEPSLNDIFEIIKEFSKKKVSMVALTGGEPFIREDIFLIIEALKKERIDIAIATNGTLLNEVKIKLLKKLEVTNIQISLEGHNQIFNDRVRGDGTFNKIMENIKLLTQYDFKVTLAHTLNKSNYEYLNEVVSLAKNLKVYAIRFELFIPIGTGFKNSDQFALEPSNVDKIKELFDNQRIKHEDSTGVKVILPQFNSEFGCGAGIFNCYLNSDLTLSPCDLLSEHLKTVKLTNPSEIEKLWNNSEVFIQWRNLKVNDTECLVCPRKNKCNSGCRASAYGYLKSLDNKDILCINRGRI